MNSSAIVRLILSPFTSSSVFLDIGHCAQHSEERNPHSILTSSVEIYIIIAILIFIDKSLTIYRKCVLVGIQLLLEPRAPEHPCQISSPQSPMWYSWKTWEFTINELIIHYKLETASQFEENIFHLRNFLVQSCTTLSWPWWIPWY